MERFFALYQNDSKLSDEMDCVSVNDEEISHQIKATQGIKSADLSSPLLLLRHGIPWNLKIKINGLLFRLLILQIRKYR